MTYTRAVAAIALTSWRLLAPLTVTVFLVLGVYAYRPNGVQESFAVTSVLSAFVCAWLVVAAERGLDQTATAILTVAAGGPAKARRGRLALVAVTACFVTALFIAWPTSSDAFDRTPGAGDILAGSLSHMACGIFGGCIALALAPPTRAAMAFAGTLAVVLASIALVGHLGPLSGVGGVADAMSHTPDNGISLGLVAACGITLAQAGALALAARSLERWRG